MSKKILFSIIIILTLIVITFGIWIFIDNSTTENNNLTDVENNITNTVNISTKYITDDCINEWTDSSKLINENTESASNNMFDENTRYLVKNIDGYINIYYLNNLNEEILYKKTDISTEYLSTEDLNNLKTGIKVIGSKELNKLLEDFE